MCRSQELKIEEDFKVFWRTLAARMWRAKNNFRI